MDDTSVKGLKCIMNMNSGLGHNLVTLYTYSALSARKTLLQASNDTNLLINVDAYLYLGVREKIIVPPHFRFNKNTNSVHVLYL